MDNVFEVGRKLGVASGIWCGGGLTIRERLTQRWQLIAIGMDLNFLLDGASAALKGATVSNKLDKIV